jgi:cytoskeletal protein RodZ
MDELGTILRETRQTRGVSIQDVSQVIRIRPRFLEALEEERYDVLPTPVHVRGFLRNYALYLKLDPEPLIARYNASRSMVKDIPLAKQVRPELDKAPPPPPETLDDELNSQPVFYRPAGINLQAPAWFSRDLLVGIFVLVLLVAAAYWAGNRYVIPAINAARATETPVETVGAFTPPAENTSVAAASSPTGTPVTETPAPTSPPISSSIQLQVTVLERSWLLMIVDGETVQEGMVQVGDLFAWDGAELVQLRTGNAAGLDVTLNGQKLGQLGERGQVVDKIWGLSGEIEPTPSPTPARQEPAPAEPADQIPTATPSPEA